MHVHCALIHIVPFCHGLKNDNSSLKGEISYKYYMLIVKFKPYLEAINIITPGMYYKDVWKDAFMS